MSLPTHIFSPDHAAEILANPIPDISVGYRDNAEFYARFEKAFLQLPEHNAFRYFAHTLAKVQYEGRATDEQAAHTAFLFIDRHLSFSMNPRTSQTQTRVTMEKQELEALKIFMNEHARQKGRRRFVGALGVTALAASFGFSAATGKSQKSQRIDLSQPVDYPGDDASPEDMAKWTRSTVEQLKQISEALPDLQARLDNLSLKFNNIGLGMGAGLLSLVFLAWNRVIADRDSPEAVLCKASSLFKQVIDQHLQPEQSR